MWKDQYSLMYDEGLKCDCEWEACFSKAVEGEKGGIVEFDIVQLDSHARILKGLVAEQISFLINFELQTVWCDRLYIHIAVQQLAWQ